MEQIVYTKEEQNAMRHMLSTFAKMQEERQIDPEDHTSFFESIFNNAMASLIDLMYLTPETEKIIWECGY